MARRRSKSDGNADAIAKRKQGAKVRLYERLGFGRWQSRPPLTDVPIAEAFDRASDDWKAHLFLSGYFENGKKQFFDREREIEGRKALIRILGSAASFVPEGIRQPVPDFILRDLCAFFAQKERRLNFKRVRTRSSEENFEMFALLVKNEMASGKKWPSAVKDTAKFFHVGKTTIQKAWAKAKREMPEHFGKPRMKSASFR